jgi:hypothetical protein
MGAARGEAPHERPASTYPGAPFTAARRAENRFTYGVDYLLIDPEARAGCPGSVFGATGRGLAALHDADHGGAPGQGAGLAWVRRGAGRGGARGGRRAGSCCWRSRGSWAMCSTRSASGSATDRDGSLRCVIAEVSNTFGDRHSYLCHHDDQRPITRHRSLRRARSSMSRPSSRSRAATASASTSARTDRHPHRLRPWRGRAGRDADRAAAAADLGPGCWRDAAPALRLAPGAGADPLAGAEALVEGRDLPPRPLPPADEVSMIRAGLPATRHPAGWAGLRRACWPWPGCRSTSTRRSSTSTNTA